MVNEKYKEVWLQLLPEAGLQLAQAKFGTGFSTTSHLCHLTHWHVASLTHARTANCVLKDWAFSSFMKLRAFKVRKNTVPTTIN